MRCVVVPETATAGVKQGYADILAVHAALLHNGRIVFFSGDQHDPGRNAIGDFDHARLFDCATLAISTPAAAPFIRDLFCCGHAMLADGRVLVAGGTQAWTTTLVGGGDPHGHAGFQHFRGTAEAFVFNPAGNQWQAVARMVPQPGSAVGGGGDPTLLALGNGHVLALSGHPTDADTRHYNNTVEVYAPSSAAGTWSDVGGPPSTLVGYDDLTYYPRCHLLKNGRVFFSSSINGQSMTWDTTSHAWAVVCAGVPDGAYSNSIAANSVLLPLLHEDGFRQRVLVCGQQTARRIDLEGPRRPGRRLRRARLRSGVAIPARTHCNSVLLPTGDVAVVGGMQDPPTIRDARFCRSRSIVMRPTAG